MIKLTVNGQQHEVDAPPDKPLLWVLREDLNLVGTKFGCGESFCGACTVHLNGVQVRSCILPVGGVGDQEVTTIEAAGDAVVRAVQRAWIDEQVPQCGYCQPGFIMATASLLRANAKP